MKQGVYVIYIVELIDFELSLRKKVSVSVYAN